MTNLCIYLEEKMQVRSFALKGAVLFLFLTTPVYADQLHRAFINEIRSKTVKQIAELYLKHNHDIIVSMCRMGKQYNSQGESYFRFANSVETLSGITKRVGAPYDVVKKDNEGKNYAMYSVCPDVY